MVVDSTTHLRNIAALRTKPDYWLVNASIVDGRVILNVCIIKEEIDRFEDQVIEGGPQALPGAADLVSQVSQRLDLSRTPPDYLHTDQAIVHFV